MKWIVVILSFATIVQGTFDSGLRVKYGSIFSIGTGSFIGLPRLKTEAEALGWTQETPPTGPLSDLEMYCSDDRRICTRHDPLTGFIGGLQIGFAKNDITKSVYNWTTQGFQSWTSAVNGTDTEFWVIQQFYITEETLQKSEDERIAARDSNITLQEDALWLSGFDGELVKIPTNLTDIIDNNFTEQAFVPMMGEHFYFNMTTSTPCRADTLFSWFLLIFQKKLVGAAISTFSTVAENCNPDWYERSGRSTVEYTVPNGPECMYELVDNYGVTTMHIYYIDQPWLMLLDL